MIITEIIKALADEKRLRILNLLLKEALCVCDLEAILSLSQSNASRHVTKLKTARLIIGEKHAQWIYYRIDDQILKRHIFLRDLLEKELGQNDKCQKDIARLKKYRELGGGCGNSIKISDD